jgi:hypothetical protein
VEENDAADPFLSHLAEFLTDVPKDPNVVLHRVPVRKAGSVNDGELGRIGCLLDNVSLAFARAFQAGLATTRDI